MAATAAIEKEVSKLRRCQELGKSCRGRRTRSLPEAAVEAARAHRSRTTAAPPAMSMHEGRLEEREARGSEEIERTTELK